MNNLQFASFEAAGHLIMEDYRIHDPTRPILFRHFVEAILRIYYLKCKQNLNQALKSLESGIGTHLEPILLGKKEAKPILHDEQIIAEKLHLFENERHAFENLLRTRPKDPNSSKFLSTIDICGMLQKAGIDMQQYSNLLMYIIDSLLEPEESIKRIESKMKALVESPMRSNNKLRKYESRMAKLINLRRGFELFDDEWASVILIFAIRISDVNPKDKKFETKAKKSLESFIIQLQTQGPKSLKTKTARVFAFSQKDYEFSNIAAIKQKQKEEKLRLLGKKRQKEDERNERMEMKMEDYDVDGRQLMGDRYLGKSEPTEDFSDGESIGGESLYIYKD